MSHNQKRGRQGGKRLRSKKKKPRKLCFHTGKICYPTQTDANNELELISIRGPVWRAECRSYQCQHCGDWHLTSEPKHETIKQNGGK